MDRTIFNEISRLGGDPSDEIWIWLVTRGPHGARFTWSQTKKEPAGYVGIDHLHRIVGELKEAIPGFEERVRVIVNLAFESQFSDIVRRAIQVAAIVGGTKELEKIRQLGASEISAVASEARASAFYLKRRI